MPYQCWIVQLIRRGCQSPPMAPGPYRRTIANEGRVSTRAHMSACLQLVLRNMKSARYGDILQNGQAFLKPGIVRTAFESVFPLDLLLRERAKWPVVALRWMPWENEDNEALSCSLRHVWYTKDNVAWQILKFRREGLPAPVKAKWCWRVLSNFEFVETVPFSGTSQALIIYTEANN